MWGQPPRLSSKRSERKLHSCRKSPGLQARTAQPARVLPRMMMEVQQHHVGHEA
jgi:hypothetical protein